MTRVLRAIRAWFTHPYRQWLRTKFSFGDRLGRAGQRSLKKGVRIMDAARDKLSRIEGT